MYQEVALRQPGRERGRPNSARGPYFWQRHLTQADFLPEGNMKDQFEDAVRCASPSSGTASSTDNQGGRSKDPEAAFGHWHSGPIAGGKNGCWLPSKCLGVRPTEQFNSRDERYHKLARTDLQGRRGSCREIMQPPACHNGSTTGNNGVEPVPEEGAEDAWSTV